MDHRGEELYSVQFSPDGRTLASGGYSNNTVRLWNVATGSLRHTLQGHSRNVVGIAFSPDGRILASNSWDRTIRLWDVATGTPHRTQEGFEESVWSMAFSPDGRMLASALNIHDSSYYRFNDSGFNGIIQLWDVTTGTLRHTLEGPAARIRSMVFSPDGRTLATGSANHVRLWDVATGTLRHTLEGHADEVWSVAFSPDGRTLASGSLDGTILLWDVVSDAAAGDFLNLATNPDGHWEAWRSGTTVTISFGSPRAPVQYHARQDPQPQFVLPAVFRPAIRVTHTMTGTRVDADGMPVSDAQPAIFDLTIDTNGEMRYVDNPKVDGLGYVDYRVMDLTWQTHEASETGEPPAPGTESPGR